MFYYIYLMCEHVSCCQQEESLVFRYLLFPFSPLALFAGPQLTDDPSQLQPAPFSDYRQYQ